MMNLASPEQPSTPARERRRGSILRVGTSTGVRGALAVLLGCALVSTGLVAATTVGAAPVGHWVLSTVAIGNSSVDLVDVNDEGDVVGFISGPSGGAFLRTADGTVTMLGDLGGGPARPMALNDARTVVGQAPTASGETRAFRWTAARGMVDLGTLGGPRTVAHDVNNSGVIVGESSLASADRRAVYWDEVTGIHEMQGTPYDPRGEAYGINDAGVVVGAAGNGVSCCDFAAVWDTAAGPAKFLPAPDGPGGPLRTSSSSAYAVNGAGTIIGSIDVGPHRAVRWPDHDHDHVEIVEDGGLLHLADLSNDGTIVGNRRIAPNNTEALTPVALSPDGASQDLPTLGGAGHAAAINDHHVVVGSVTTNDPTPIRVIAVWTFVAGPSPTSTAPTTTAPPPVIAPAPRPRPVPVAPAFTG